MTKIVHSIDHLTEKSTPCEICVAITGRAIEENTKPPFYDPHFCETRVSKYEDGPGGLDKLGGSSCTDAHKAQIKMLYLIYAQLKRRTD